MIRTGATGSNVKQCRDTIVNNTTVPSLAKKTRDFSTAGSNRAYPNRESKENKYSHSMPELIDKVCTMQTIYHRHR